MHSLVCVFFPLLVCLIIEIIFVSIYWIRDFVVRPYNKSVKSNCFNFLSSLFNSKNQPKIILYEYLIVFPSKEKLGPSGWITLIFFNLGPSGGFCSDAL